MKERKITYVENYKWDQFALMNCNNLSPEVYPKQVEFKNVSESEFGYLIEAPVEEIKEKIKNILNAHYPED